MAGNALYYGDNLEMLRAHIPSGSVDLVYLDPPFNSKRDYNQIFKTPKGHRSDAQITAFEDSWHWGPQAEHEYDGLLRQSNSDIAELIKAFRSFLGKNDLMAYLTMMSSRLLELRRVLKPTGSLYLHCDPTASHYLKIVLDGIFGKTNFQNEIVWKRTGARGDARRWNQIQDYLFFYTGSKDFTWNQPYAPHSEEYVDGHYRSKDESGRRYQLTSIISPNPRPNMMYEWKGFPSPEKGWRFSKETMARLDAEGRIWYQEDKTKRPRYKRYLDEMAGIPMGSVWTDIAPLNSQAQERIGYPTQKPIALLERIILASSNEGDVLLDPFCGCGTAVHAAQKLGRRWIGIDITHLAISLIEKRLNDAFGSSCKFDVHGTPKDLASAHDLAARDKYQFQWWAVSRIDAQPFQQKKKGADGGIDGIKFFNDIEGEARKIVVSVKGGASLKADDIRALNHVRSREGAEIGILISLAEPSVKMKGDAASAGFYVGGANGTTRYPRLQLLTIEGLLSGKQRAEHPDYVPSLNFKTVTREKNQSQRELAIKPPKRLAKSKPKPKSKQKKLFGDAGH
jgi:site-specific DNA-methyltransferase (adenine-specific)